MPHWIFLKVLMRNKLLIWNGLKNSLLQFEASSLKMRAYRLLEIQF